MNWTSTFADSVRDFLFLGGSLTPPASWYLSAHTDTTPSGGNECSGGSYARQAVTWAAGSTGQVASSGSVTVPIPTGQTAVAVALWDASTSGNMLATATLDASVTSGSLTFDAGNITDGLV